MVDGEGKVQLSLREHRHKQVLSRLAMDPKDAGALVALYEDHEGEIRAAALRWLGKNRELCEQAVCNILVAVARQAPTYDPQFTDPMRWVSRVADAEAKKLREALDSAAGKNPRRGTSL